jgi:arsenical pump membrane protein
MLALTIAVSAVSCAAVMLLALLKPSVNIKGEKIDVFWIPALIGAVILICVKSVSADAVFTAFTADNAVNPLKILALFISMTIMSVYLDEVGFFRYLACVVLRKAGANQLKIFTALYFVVAALTIVTSNDIIVLTFSPFICCFAKNAKINPVPYLAAEFVSANTWSMMLIIGNPTNIYLAVGADINFASYFSAMALPAVLSGLTAYAVLLLIFKRQLNGPAEPQFFNEKIEDKAGFVTGVAHLLLCTLLLAVSSYLNLEMWYICPIFATSLFLCVLIEKTVKKEKTKILLRCLKRAPWELIPFVLSMSVIVLALEKYGAAAEFAAFLGARHPILSYGVSSMLFANIVNNIPMSVFYGAVTARVMPSGCPSAVYASVIGSNIGAFLTPIGALAGVMWMGILKRHNVKFSFFDFLKYGFLTAVPTLFAALSGLYIASYFAF